MSVNQPIPEGKTPLLVNTEETSKETTSKPINSLKEHLNNIQIETGTRATFQNKNGKEIKPKSKYSGESRQVKEKRRERTSNP